MNKDKSPVHAVANAQAPPSSLMQAILDSPSPEHSSSQFSAAFQIMFN